MRTRAAVRRRLGMASVPRVTGGLPPAPAWVRSAFVDGAVAMTPDLAWRIWLVVLVVVCVAAVSVGGLGLALVSGGALVVGPVLVLRTRKGRAAELLEKQLPGGLEAIARSLRSGASLGQSIAEAASCGRQLGAELGLVATDARRGLSLDEALERLPERRPLPGVRLAVAALSLGAETGGAQARAIDGVAATLRERLAVAADVHAHASQVRASVWVISLAPLVFCVFATSADPRTADFLFRTPLGWAFLAAGLGLDALSAIWMRRLTRAVA